MKSPITKQEKDELWESLCDNCGKCCAIDKEKGIACPGLDCVSNKCTVYDKRHTTEMCLRVRPSNTLYLHSIGVLPDTCAYVRVMQNKPPLPRGIARVNLIPFNVANPDLQKHYILRREAWLSDQPKSA